MLRKRGRKNGERRKRRRNCDAAFLGAFSCNAQVSCAIDAELLAVIEVIKVAKERGWFPLWIETDSMLALQYFKKPCLTPWRLRVQWMNSLNSISQFQVHVSHVFREGNQVADKLANYGALNSGKALKELNHMIQHQITPFYWSSGSQG